MAGTLGPLKVSTKLRRVAEQSRQAPDKVWKTLSHLIDVELLREAFRRTRKSGAIGVDGQTATEYAEDLDENLKSLRQPLTGWQVILIILHMRFGIRILFDFEIILILIQGSIIRYILWGIPLDTATPKGGNQTKSRPPA